MASQPRVAHELLPAPLPFAISSPPGFLGRLSRTVQRRVQRRSHWQEWCNQGVEAPNALYSPLASVARLPANDSQQQCLASLAAEYRKVGAPPFDFSAAGAFDELCGRPVGYSSDESSTRVTFQPGRTAMLEQGSTPTPVGKLLGEGDSQYGLRWQQLLLRDPDDALRLRAELGVRQLYSDPALVGSGSANRRGAC